MLNYVYKYLKNNSKLYLSSLLLLNKINNISFNEPKKYNYFEIKKHDNLQDGIWVTYKNNVYNISDYINKHPGGVDKILLASGSGLEPYWNIYKQHLNKQNNILEILETMKIGEISDYDPNKYNDLINHYTNEPDRNPDLIYHNLTPCNAETPTDLIMENWITPIDSWYIRNHQPVPIIDINLYKLSIYDLNDKEIKLSMDYLKNIDSTTIISTIQCGGNRRNDSNKLSKTLGTPWNYGAISNAVWTGVNLKDLLNLIGITDDEIKKKSIKHVHFEGIDGVKVSIPIKKVLDPLGDVIVAYNMNGQELSRDHGYPLRIIVPGHVGIRNIKWLKSITLSDREVEGSWQTGISYKPFPHYIEKMDNFKLENLYPIQEMPIQSCVVELNKLDNNILNIKGFAWSGGGRRIIRVDVSIDNCVTWYTAKLNEGSDQEFNRAWAWTFWSIDIEDITNKHHSICCKAVDESFNTQPSENYITWNIRGLLNNSWHKNIDI